MVRYCYLLLLLIGTFPPIYSQLYESDSPKLIDEFLQLVWEPTSLIRMWVGLDQLFNIVRSWRGVAKKLATLPFGEDESTSHIRIQEPRSYPKPSVASQWDRFNEIYSSSNLSPIVALAGDRLLHQHHQQTNSAQSSDLRPVISGLSPPLFKTDFNNAHSSSLPPLFLFQPQEVFLKPEFNNLMQNLKVPGRSFQFPYRGNPVVSPKMVELQRQASLLLRQQKLANALKFPIVQNKAYSDSAVKNQLSPQERLNMLLVLMKTLGAIHNKKIASVHASNFAQMQGDRFASMNGNYIQVMNRKSDSFMHESYEEPKDILEFSDQ